jgi:hypothetical protein
LPNKLAPREPPGIGDQNGPPCGKPLIQWQSDRTNNCLGPPAWVFLGDRATLATLAGPACLPPTARAIRSERFSR